MPSPDTPELVDFVVRLQAPARLTRTFIVRAADEATAMGLLHDATQPGGVWDGWTIGDVMTVAESIVRRAGQR